MLVCSPLPVHLDGVLRFRLPQDEAFLDRSLLSVCAVIRELPYLFYRLHDRLVLQTVYLCPVRVRLNSRPPNPARSVSLRRYSRLAGARYYGERCSNCVYFTHLFHLRIRLLFFFIAEVFEENLEIHLVVVLGVARPRARGFQPVCT